MSDVEDWDFDEEFLKDIDDKAIVFYSQDHDNKQLNLDSQETPYMSTDNYLNNDSNKSYNHKKQSIQNQGTSRKHFILHTLKQENSISLFKKKPLANIHNIVNKPLSTTTANDMKYNQEPDTNAYVISSRQKMIVDILTKRCSLNRGDENRNLSNENIPTTLGEQRTSENITLNLNKHSIDNHNVNSISLSSEHNEDILPLSTPNMKRNSMSSEVKKRKKFKGSLINTPKNSSSDLQQARIILIRKFAGPAGLLPNAIHTHSICSASLKDIDEQNNPISELTNLGEMNCWSQNTRNLFTEGAWQIMLDNLSENVKEKVKNNNISSLLQTARKQFKQNVRVEYFAGILENLQCHNNLVHFNLKDSTGNIPAVTFHDVAVKYPQTLANNAVILLHNVNVIRIFQSAQYRLVITPNNILGIYNDKCKTRTDGLRQASNNLNNDASDLNKSSPFW